MSMAIKWLGLDFGQTLMDGTGQRTALLIGDTSKQLGEPELTEERCHRWRLMKEKYGSYPVIKEGHKPEIMSYVFDGHPRAAEVFTASEQKLIAPTDGVVDALEYLRSEGITIAVVSELKKVIGVIGKDDMTSRFLKNKNIMGYFDELVTPLGRVNYRNGSIDLKYQGSSKEQGSLYDLLAEDLLKQGLKTSEAVIVGDKEWSDITPAQKRGFKTIQFVGIVNHGPSNADYVMRHFRELKDIVRKG